MIINLLKKVKKKVKVKFRKYSEYLLLLRLKQIKTRDLKHIYITCEGSKDGGCSQILKRLSAIAFSHHFGFTYLHTPLSEVKHNVNNASDWSKQWEDFFNLDQHFAPANSQSRFRFFEKFNQFLFHVLWRGVNEDQSFYKIRYAHGFTDRNPSAYLAVKNKLQEGYRSSTRTPNLIYNENVINIAIHARRGDVNADEPVRFTHASRIHSTIEIVRNALTKTGLKTEFYLFTASPDDDLIDLKSSGIHVIHEMSIFDVLDHLIHSDIHITSKSSVSYVSAIIGDGIVLYEPFWHSSLPGWLNIEENYETELIKMITKSRLSHGQTK